MPRYDFKCRICGVTFEAIAPYTTDVLPCPSCNNTTELLIALADRQVCKPAAIIMGGS